MLRPSVEKRSFPPPNSLSVVVPPQLQNETFMHAQQHYEKDFCFLDLSRSRYWFNGIISKLGKKSRFWIKQGLLSLLPITAMCNVKQDKSTTELWSRSASCRENPYQARLTAYGRYKYLPFIKFCKFRIKITNQSDCMVQYTNKNGFYALSETIRLCWIKERSWRLIWTFLK